MMIYPRKQLLAALFVYIGQLLVGFGLGWTAPVVPKLQNPDQTPLPNVISDQQASLVGSVLYIGTIGGPYITSYLSNRVGRKPSLLLGGFVCVLSFLVLALANSLTMVFAGRILNGFGIGIVFVMNLVYVGEIASTPIRGILLTATAIFSTMGTLVVYSVGPYVSYSATSYIGLAIAMVYIGGILYIPETPLFLVMKGKETKAKETLKFLDREEEIDEFLSSKEEKADPNKFSDLFTIKSNRKALFITLSLNIFQQLSGVIVVTFFVTNIFDLADSSIEPNIATIIIGVTQLASSCITPFFVERFGRKILLLLSTAVCFLSLGTLGTYFFLYDRDSAVAASVKWLPLATLMLFFMFYDFGFGIIPGTFIGEMFTPSVRSVGATVTVTVGWLVGFAVASAFGSMLQLGAHVVFWFYTAGCAGAFIFSLLVVPETKGKSLLEVQEMLNR